MDSLKHYFLSAVAFLLTAATSWGAIVVFHLRDFVSEVPGLSRKTMQIQPLSTVKGNVTNLVITSERRSYNIGTNAQANLTNMFGGEYRVFVMGNTWTSVFKINVPDTNGTLYASDLITSSTSTAIDNEDGTPLDIE